MSDATGAKTKLCPKKQLLHPEGNRHKLDKCLMSKKCRELKLPSNNSTRNPTEKCQKHWNKNFSKEELQISTYA
jgi:hypothetical protein